MYTYKYFKEKFLKSFPVILIYFLSFNSFEGLKEIRVLGREEYFFNEVREGVINTNRYI